MRAAVDAFTSLQGQIELWRICERDSCVHDLSFGNWAVSGAETPGFAPPPHGGFALSGVRASGTRELRLETRRCVAPDVSRRGGRLRLVWVFFTLRRISQVFVARMSKKRSNGCPLRFPRAREVELAG
jgi:hypothetical protein